MFFVFNKDKIESYLVSVGTVVILLLVSVAFQNNISRNTIATSTNIVKENTTNMTNIVNDNLENNYEIDDENLED